MIGRILWWDSHDGHGIVVGSFDDKEYYIDSSVFPHSDLAMSGARVSFEPNLDIAHCRCGKDVKLDLDHLAQLQYSIVGKLTAYGADKLRAGAIDEALATLGRIVALKGAV